jgi:hypothetical protein
VWTRQRPGQCQLSPCSCILLSHSQIIAITSAFAVPWVRIKWWIIAVILECLEAAIICGVGPIRAPLELAYLVPVTSQILAMVAVIQASRGLPNRAPKRLASHLLTTGLMFIILSTLVLGLSVAGFLHRQVYVQCSLFILSLAIGLQLPDSNERSAIHLTRRLHRRFTGRASRHNSYQFLPVSGPTDGLRPPPDAHFLGKGPSHSNG